MTCSGCDAISLNWLSKPPPAGTKKTCPMCGDERLVTKVDRQGNVTITSVVRKRKP